MKGHFAASLLLVAGWLALSASAYAHHGTVAYDPGEKITLKGSIAKFEWRNPHTQIRLDVTGEKGNVVHWSFEAQPPNVLIHVGWNKDSLKAGDHVTIIASPAKNGAPVGVIQKVMLANGQELTMMEK